MPVTKITDKDLLLPLNKLLEANDRLANAINGTKSVWPYTTHCWIDQMSEPTIELANHRVGNEKKDKGVGDV